MLSMKDSGALGYYTSQPLMNLDGVFSTREYNEALCRGEASAEMDAAGVAYVAHHRVPADYEEYVIDLPCWNEGTSPSTLTFTPAQEVYRGEPHWNGGPNRVFVIWRWEP